MISIAEFAPRLITWQRQSGRHDLPWQHDDPYCIWLSEIMLQQTQVSTVIAYYLRFIERFPNLTALANAPLDEVMALWSGLGYYSRARNLHRCAQQLVAEHDGHFPNDVNTLITLPGIGRSTAAAIAVFAFGARETILDGNVKRVLARVFGIEGFPGEKQIENAMWKLAESLLPLYSGQDKASNNLAIKAYTQGLMDFGATLCVRGRPACARCPFQSGCVAYLSGREKTLPTARPKKIKPMRRTLMLILCNGDAVLLERRPPAGIWGGLWSLPEATDDATLAAYAARFGVLGPLTALPSIIHTFTHFQLTIEPRLAALSSSTATAAAVADANQAWVSADDVQAYGLPAPVRRILDKLQSEAQADILPFC